MKQTQEAAQAEYLRTIMANSKEVKCVCGGKYFSQVFAIRKVSKLMTGMTEDSMLPIPTFRCDDCGAPVSELEIPETPKPAPPSTIIGV